jgi:hypothetical protein
VGRAPSRGGEEISNCSGGVSPPKSKASAVIDRRYSGLVGSVLSIRYSCSESGQRSGGLPQLDYDGKPWRWRNRLALTPTLKRYMVEA